MEPWGALVVPAELNGHTLDLLCELLTELDVDYLRSHPETPPVYASGVFYEGEEDGGPEDWLAIPWVLHLARSGYGSDCKRLAAWRAAELRVAGEREARCVWSAHPEPDRLIVHIRVKRASGHLEDPSEVLGMRQYQAYRSQLKHYQQASGASASWNLGPFPSSAARPFG